MYNTVHKISYDKIWIQANRSSPQNIPYDPQKQVSAPISPCKVNFDTDEHL